MLAFMKQLDKDHIWGGATNWTGVLRSSIITTKTEEEIEVFSAFQEEANEEESLSSHEKKKILPHQDQTFIKAQKKAAAGQSRTAAKMTRRSMKMLIPLQIGPNATLRVPDVDRGTVNLKNFLDCLI
ncbi:hypothetical protein T09_602 [Trichinella sp. T9]|nr:hypothetical protein T09_602 [Trichinella sp. T9]